MIADQLLIVIFKYNKIWLVNVTVGWDRQCNQAANCLITLPDYNFADSFEQSTAVYAPITFKEIKITMTNDKNKILPPPPFINVTSHAKTYNNGFLLNG